MTALSWQMQQMPYYPDCNITAARFDFLIINQEREKACKSLYPGSIPGEASKFLQHSKHDEMAHAELARLHAPGLSIARDTS
jgi:hypothetical protein